MDDSPAPQGFLHAYLLDGSGAGRPLSWKEVAAWQPDHGVLWLHMDYTAPAVQQWLENASGLDPLAVEALLSEETRPRATALGEGLLMALRGVNTNPGADPEDMVAIRLWIDRYRIVSTRRRDLLSVHDLTALLDAGKGPADAAEFLVDLTDHLVARMDDTVDQFEDRAADLEDRILSAESAKLRNELADLRRQTIALRRYLAPQRDALTRLLLEKVAWLDDQNRLRLREVADRLIRHVENLDAVRERATVTQEELANRLSEHLNKRIYLLSVVAAIFLPLSFLTGLFGVNLGGIPGSNNPHAFKEFLALLVVVVLIQMWIFKKDRWL